jgi:steroid delta-isomerase-like uncharacterized protein
MFARNVSLRLKPGKLNEFTRTFDKEVLSIMRRQAGFREEITFALPGEVELIAISLWDTKEQADAYNASDYPKVLEAVNALLDGAPKVQHLNVLSLTIQQAGGESGQPAGNESGKAASASSAAAAGDREMSSTTENKEIARRFMEECWNKGDSGAMRDLIADQCRYHDPAFPGVENVQQHITSCRSAFPDLRFTIEDMIGERNEVVVHWTVRGTHKGPFLGMQPTNRQCTVSGTSISRIEGGKVTEHWADWNVMNLMEQLGVTTAPRAEEKVNTK